MAEGSPTLTRMPSLANWVNPSASVSPRPSRESLSPEREQDTGITLIPTGRFGFPTQAMLAAVQAQGEQDTEGPPPPSPPPEFAGVFKPRIKPKLPLDHVVMMHQAYVETNPVPKSGCLRTSKKLAPMTASGKIKLEIEKFAAVLSRSL